MRKLVDSNIIVYSLLDNHPASEVCRDFLESKLYKFYISPIIPFEIYHVLHRVYGVPKSDAREKALLLFQASIEIFPVDGEMARNALEKAVTHGLELNGSLLLAAGIRYEIPSIATEDRRLLNISTKHGIFPQTPVTDEIKGEIDEWERRIPPKGLQRILKAVYRWIKDRDEGIAEAFKDESQNFKTLPR